MSYEHCEKHKCDATNGCELCLLERSHFHPCSDGLFCNGIGSTYCEELDCRKDNSRLDGSREVWLADEKPCVMCQLGRKPLNEQR